jgi:hypothetical protein
LGQNKVAYKKSAFYLAWKCLKSLCGGGGWVCWLGWLVLKVNLVISFGFGQAEQLARIYQGKM